MRTVVAELAPPLDRALEAVLLHRRATARSKAAHTMTREWVKWRGGPRISHSPLSGSSQWLARSSTRAHCRAQHCGVYLQAGLARLLERDHHLAEHVGLPLVDRTVADAHRLGPGIPGQVVEGALGQSPGAVDRYMICRSSGSPATARSSQLRQSRASSR